MSRILTVLFRRNPMTDRQQDQVQFEGYQMMWPDGRALSLGFDALCKHGQRMFGLGKQLRGESERLVDMLCFPVPDHESDLTRLPGHRVRRFGLERHGQQGRIYFFDGTPTTMVFDLDRDERTVTDWLGLPELADGERVWFDLAARVVDPARTTVYAGESLPAPLLVRETAL
jgi:hypothetical protein